MNAILLTAARTGFTYRLGQLIQSCAEPERFQALLDEVDATPLTDDGTLRARIVVSMHMAKAQETIREEDVTVEVASGPAGSAGFRSGTWTGRFRGERFAFRASVPHRLPLEEQEDRLRRIAANYLRRQAARPAIDLDLGVSAD